MFIYAFQHLSHTTTLYTTTKSISIKKTDDQLVKQVTWLTCSGNFLMFFTFTNLQVGNTAPSFFVHALEKYMYKLCVIFIEMSKSKMYTDKKKKIFFLIKNHITNTISKFKFRFQSGI